MAVGAIAARAPGRPPAGPIDGMDGPYDGVGAAKRVAKGKAKP